MVGVGHCVNSVGPQGYTQPRARQVFGRKAREKNKKKKSKILRLCPVTYFNGLLYGNGAAGCVYCIYTRSAWFLVRGHLVSRVDAATCLGGKQAALKNCRRCRCEWKSNKCAARVTLLRFLLFCSPAAIRVSNAPPSTWTPLKRDAARKV